MTIESTAQHAGSTQTKSTTEKNQERVPSRSSQNCQRACALSRRTKAGYYFWGKHVNTGRHDWSILCKEDQVSWVIEQMESNVQLTEGFHFRPADEDRERLRDKSHPRRAVLPRRARARRGPPMHWARATRCPSSRRPPRVRPTQKSCGEWIPGSEFLLSAVCGAISRPHS